MLIQKAIFLFKNYHADVYEIDLQSSAVRNMRIFIYFIRISKGKKEVKLVMCINEPYNL